MGYYLVEQSLNQLAGVHSKHLRPAYFYNNLLGLTSMIRHAGIIGSNYSTGDQRFPMVSPIDIAIAAAEELSELNFTGHSIRYVASDEVSTNQIASVLGNAIGNPALTWTAFTNEQALAGMLQSGVPEEMAKNYIELNQALHTGTLHADYFRLPYTPSGTVSFMDFSKIFADAYAV